MYKFFIIFISIFKISYYNSDKKFYYNKNIYKILFKNYTLKK